MATATHLSRGLVMPIGTPPGMKELIEQIDNKDGVLTTKMQSIRDAYGKERLGKHILEDIDRIFLRLGIEHQPRKLPTCQDHVVRLYRANSPVGKLIKAGVVGSSSNDEVLRRAAASKTAATLKQVREQVEQLCEVLDEEYHHHRPFAKKKPQGGT